MVFRFSSNLFYSLVSLGTREEDADEVMDSSGSNEENTSTKSNALIVMKFRIQNM